jgi:ethanolamine utilization protein EutQ
MTQTAAGISLFTPDDVDTWHQSEDREIYLGDVVDPSNSDTMSVGFARYAPGESNEWVVTYDEALIVTRGTYSVSSADGVETTAQAGEVIFLREGTQVVYSASDAGAEVVYVTYPHWVEAQQRSAHAALLETFHLVDGAPAPHAAAREEDNVALLRSIYGPLERGESHDFQAFFDHIADDVVFVLPVGELTGKEAVVEHFANGAELLEFNPFERPLEYIASGDRVVQLGEETFTVKATGVSHRDEWARVFDIHDGLITRIVAMHHLGEVADALAEAVSRARSAQAVG